ncbi:MAG: hypothetical protein K6F48_09455 [Paludibacteraceae bacterium]|nr:hypothetical protein [Paludibacteraceae bacterium]
MDSKDLMSLISEDVKEISLLCSGMSEMSSVPASVLSLAKGKVSSLLRRIEMLESCQEGSSSSKRVEAPVREVPPEVEIVKAQPVEAEVAPKAVEVNSKQVHEAPKAEAVEEKHLEKVVENVEYQSAEDSAPVAESMSAKRSCELPKEKHDVSARFEVKTHAHEGGNVRTVLDANRSSKRVESRFVQSIRKAITLNDRIRYMNELFGGDAELMSTSIAALDAMESLREATDYVKRNFSWNEEDEAVADFMRLLEDRFS